MQSGAASLTETQVSTGDAGVSPADKEVRSPGRTTALIGDNQWGRGRLVRGKRTGAPQPVWAFMEVQ